MIFNRLLVGSFFILSFIGIINHEMWRDELQAWLIARDSSSIINLFHNLKYEGHPGLWHLGLYLLNQFTHNPIVMQLYHLLIATTTVYIFARFSPFTKLQKILFSFGYFPGYEYAIISRNYALGILFIFLFCALYPQRFQKKLIIFLILFLLANSNFYGAMIAVAIFFTLIIEVLSNKNNRNSLSSKEKKLILIFFSICLVIMGGVIYMIVPPADMVSGLGIKTKLEFYPLLYSLNAIWRSYIPIPYIPIELYWWNTNILEYAALELTAIYSLLLIIVAWLLLIKTRQALILYSLGTGIILSFDYLKYAGQIRHHGHLFILLIACLWIGSYETNANLLDFAGWLRPLGNLFTKIVSLTSKYQKQIITILLIVHFSVGVFAYSKDLIQPFSGIKETALYIKKLPFHNEAIVAGYQYTINTGLAAFLNRKIYYLQNDDYASFVVWRKNFLKEIKPTEVIDKVKELAIRANKKIILVLEYQLEPQIIKQQRSDLKISELFVSQESISGERTFLYLVEAK